MPEETPKNNTLGIISLVSGIVGIVLAFCCYPVGIILAILALICGIIGNQRGQQYAMAGIVLGAIALLLAIVLIILGAFFFEPIIEEILRDLQQQQF